MKIAYRFGLSLILVYGLTLLPACGSEEQGSMAILRWDPVADPRVVSYTVHYGRQSSGESGSCNYENSVDVSVPRALVAGLASNTVYYFAVSVTVDNGLRSTCSNEVSKVTEGIPIPGEP